MARLADQQIIAALFDRLTDNEPLSPREVLPPGGEQLRGYEISVARDLTNLLNTRRSDGDIPEEFKQTRNSVAAYGLQDFTTAPTDPEMIRRAIERAVRLFEPRLSRLQVTAPEGSEFQLSFQIAGVLQTDAGLAPVLYDAELPTVSRRFQVRTGR